MTFPSDANGDVFRRMLSVGDDLTKPRDVDFNHVFAKEEEARQFVDAVQRLGYERTTVGFWDARKQWDVRVAVFMLPTHQEVTRVESNLGAMARGYLGRADGWGCQAVV